MAGRVQGKVAFISGVARGQGRSHAIRLAAEGADIIGVDILEDVETNGYPMATQQDLDETVRAVESLDRRIVARKTDVRDFDALKAVVDEGVAELGRLDIVSGNAGISGELAQADVISEKGWREMIDINLTGVWHTVKAAIPHMKDAGNGGSIILTSSTAGIKGYENLAHYTAAKHGVVGLMKSLTLELARHNIRVNSIHPTSVATDMILNQPMYDLFRPDLESPTSEDMKEVMYGMNALPVPWIEPIDISNALLFLASDEARYITGLEVRVDAGQLAK